MSKRRKFQLILGLFVALIFVFGLFLAYQRKALFSSAEVTFTEERITTDPANHYHPAIWGDKIVWQDDRRGNSDIYLYDLVTNAERQITTSMKAASSPAIWGNKIVWPDGRNGNFDIYLYDLATNTERQITTDPADQYFPAVYENKIVWMDDRNNNWDIYLYDLASAAEQQITTNPALQELPAIWGNKIVWPDSRNGNVDIYMATLAETYVLKGKVYDAVTKQPLSNNQVTLVLQSPPAGNTCGYGNKAATTPTADYQIDPPVSGKFKVQIINQGLNPLGGLKYKPQVKDVTLTLGQVTTLNFYLTPVASTEGTVSGTLSGFTNSSEFQQISFPGTDIKTPNLVPQVYSSQGGIYQTILPQGTYEITAVTSDPLNCKCKGAIKTNVAVTAGQKTVADFPVNPGGYATGKVSRNGSVQSGATVSVSPLEDIHKIRWVQTNSAGIYRTGCLVARSYTLAGLFKDIWGSDAGTYVGGAQVTIPNNNTTVTAPEIKLLKWQ